MTSNAYFCGVGWSQVESASGSGRNLDWTSLFSFLSCFIFLFSLSSPFAFTEEPAFLPALQQPVQDATWLPGECHQTAIPGAIGESVGYKCELRCVVPRAARMLRCVVLCCMCRAVFNTARHMQHKTTQRHNTVYCVVLYVCCIVLVYVLLCCIVCMLCHIVFCCAVLCRVLCILLCCIVSCCIVWTVRCVVLSVLLWCCVLLRCVVFWLLDMVTNDRPGVVYCGVLEHQ